MWRWVVFFLFLLKKQQHLQHKKITSQPAAATLPACLWTAPTHRAAHHLRALRIRRQWAVSAGKAEGNRYFTANPIIEGLQAGQGSGRRF